MMNNTHSPKSIDNIKKFSFCDFDSTISNKKSSFEIIETQFTNFNIISGEDNKSFIISALFGHWLLSSS